MKSVALLAIAVLNVALGEIRVIEESHDPRTTWILELLQNIHRPSEGTLDVVLSESVDPTIAKVFDQLRVALDQLPMAKHESRIGRGADFKILYVFDGTNANQLVKKFRSSQTIKSNEYFVIVVNSEITKTHLQIFRRTRFTMLLFVDISRDPPQVQRVSPADHKSTIFAENATFATIFDDRDDWKSREVHIMFNPRDPPYTMEMGGSLTGLDIEVFCYSCYPRRTWQRPSST